MHSIYYYIIWFYKHTYLGYFYECLFPRAMRLSDQPLKQEYVLAA